MESDGNRTSSDEPSSIVNGERLPSHPSLADSDDLQFVDDLAVEETVEGSRGISPPKEGNADTTTADPPAIDSADPLSQLDAVPESQLETLPGVTADVTADSAAVQSPGTTSGDGLQDVDFEPVITELPAPEASAPVLLKHFIDGFIIEESTEPFPVHQSSLLTELQQRTKKKVAPARRKTLGGTPRQNSAVKQESAPSQPATPCPTPPALETHTDERCAHCGSEIDTLCFYRGEPHCSRLCVQRHKRRRNKETDGPKPKRGRPVGALTRNKPTTKNSGKLADVVFSRYRRKTASEDGEPASTSQFNIVKQEPMEITGGVYPPENGYESENSMLSDGIDHGYYRRSDVMHWTMSDVRDFIMCLDGCQSYAQVFVEQEIDGIALMLLNEDHLINALDIKVGPALKIHQSINCFR